MTRDFESVLHAAIIDLSFTARDLFGNQPC
jgi:hypothetical protein